MCVFYCPNFELTTQQTAPGEETQCFEPSCYSFSPPIMTNVIVNQCCAEPSQAHAVPTGHPALKWYACLPSVVILDTRWHHTMVH